MGNGLSMEIHKWSSAAFPEEYTLVYTSLTDKSKRSILHLRGNPERVLLRLPESVCAQRDNMNCFNFRKVSVVVHDTSQQTQFKGQDSLSDLCGRKSCFYEVMCKVESSGSVERVSCEFSHSNGVTLTTHIRYHEIIECDKETGLRANIRGPFKCEGQVPRQKCVTSSLIQRDVKEEPSKAIRVFVQSESEGKEYNLFQGASDKQSVNIVNTGALFHGHGNASKFESCNILMQTFVDKSPSP